MGSGAGGGCIVSRARVTPRSRARARRGHGYGYGGMRCGRGRPAFALVAFAAGLSFATTASAQEPPLELQRLRGRIEVDGDLSDAAWRDITPLPLTTYAPVYGAPPTQRTEIRIAYDDENLYAAGWFYDDDPSGIRINSLYRDRWNGDDAFAIYIDAFNDNRTAKWFGTTPGGIRFDILLADDGVTQNASWDTFWSAETRVTSEGWFAEVRIPFSSLGFQPDAQGRAIMGLTVTRLVSRTGERVTFPAIDPTFAFRRPSVARDVMLRDVRSHKPVYVTPYALTGVQRSVPDGELTAVQNGSTEVGLDVRYPVTSTLTLDLTANTDFAQVEADDQQVNLDRFPLFFPERRRFFQEGSGVFDFETGAGVRLFHSRRIGLTPAGEPVPVDGGLRMVGRAGLWDVGLLGMHTGRTLAGPAETFGVVRLARPVLNPYSSAGAMLTSRLSDDRHNIALGLDATLRLFGNEYLTMKWAGTSDDTESPDADALSRSLFDLHWERRTNRGLYYNFRFTRAGQDFQPDLGFAPRTNFSRFDVLSNLYFFTDSHRVLRRIWPGMLAFTTLRNDDGSLESGTYAVWVQWDTKAGGGGWIEPKLFIEDVRDPFPIGNRITIPAGRYTFADLQLFLFMNSGTRLRTVLDFRAGSYFDGTRVQLILQPTWNVASHLELGADYQLTRLRFDDRGQGDDIHIGRLRLRSALNARASGNAFVQYNSTTDRLDFNVRLRYAFAEGTDLWLVYNEGLDTERTNNFDGLRTPLSRARSVIIKYTHTFGF